MCVGSLEVSSGSFRVAWIRSRTARGSLGAFTFIWVHSGSPGGRRVQLDSLEFAQAHLIVLGFVRALLGSLRSGQMSAS